MLGMMLYISMYVIVWCLTIDVTYGLVQYGILTRMALYALL